MRDFKVGDRATVKYLDSISADLRGKTGTVINVRMSCAAVPERVIEVQLDNPKRREGWPDMPIIQAHPSRFA